MARKRTNKNVPAKGRLRDMADQLWSLAVRHDWYNRCAICQAVPVEAHHLIPRQHEGTRYNTRNGIALCSRCHQFDPDVSPHQNAMGFSSWLHRTDRGLWRWVRDNQRPRFDGVKNAAYYCDVIWELRRHLSDEEWRKVVGVKFSAYLMETMDNG